MPIFDSQYPVNSNPAGEDKILTTDTSDSSAVKSVTLTKLQEWLGSISKWVTNGMIADGAVDTLQIADQAVTYNKIDLATFTSTPDQISNVTFPSGVTYSPGSNLTKLSNMAIFTGFFQNSGNFGNGDLVATLPVGYRPVAGTFRAAAYSTSSTHNGGRVEVSTDGQVIVRNVTAAGTLVFELVFPTA